jgi:REP element-mobilizing transposase RayT
MDKRAKQTEFQIPGFIKPSDAFGGSSLKGNARSARPLDSKLPIHLTLRARKSVLRLPRTFATVEKLIDQTAKKYGVKIFKRANVGNHLHMVIQMNTWMWAKFIRELTGRIAQVLKALGLSNLSNTSDEAGFWLFKPHTRIVRGWRQAFRSALDYIELNRLEADGFISRKETNSLKELRLIWADG